MALRAGRAGRFGADAQALYVWDDVSLVIYGFLLTNDSASALTLSAVNPQGVTLRSVTLPAATEPVVLDIRADNARMVPITLHSGLAGFALPWTITASFGGA